MESSGRHGLASYQIRWRGQRSSSIHRRMFFSIPFQSLLLKYLNIHSLRGIFSNQWTWWRHTANDWNLPLYVSYIVH
jgi:hypothetical protein